MIGHVPAITQAAKWPFGKALHTQLCADNYCLTGEQDPNKEIKTEKMNACIAARNALENLSQTQCSVCAGFGHSKKYCPTSGRLTTLMSFHPVCSSKLAAARNRMTIEKAHHLEATAPVPKCTVPYKRRRISGGGSVLAGKTVALGFSQ